MRRNQARNQMLALGLLALLGLISLDLAPVQALMTDVLDGTSHEEVALVEAEPQGPAPRVVVGPSLAVRGEAERQDEACPGCGAPQIIAVESVLTDAAIRVQVTKATAAIRTDLQDRLPLHVNGQGPLLTSRWISRPSRWTSLAPAVQALGLDEAQRLSWTLALEDARRDMDDLRHVANDDGDSWHSISSSIVDARGDLSKALTLAQRLAAFASSALLGGETYAEARGRLILTYTDRLRGELTPEQMPLFESHDVGPLFDPVRVAAGAMSSVRRPRGMHVRVRLLRS